MHTSPGRAAPSAPSCSPLMAAKPGTAASFRTPRILTSATSRRSTGEQPTSFQLVMVNCRGSTRHPMAERRGRSSTRTQTPRVSSTPWHSGTRTTGSLWAIRWMESSSFWRPKTEARPGPGSQPTGCRPHSQERAHSQPAEHAWSFRVRETPGSAPEPGGSSAAPTGGGIGRSTPRRSGPGMVAPASSRWLSGMPITASPSAAILRSRTGPAKSALFTSDGGRTWRIPRAIATRRLPFRGHLRYPVPRDRPWSLSAQPEPTFRRRWRKLDKTQRRRLPRRGDDKAKDGMGRRRARAHRAWNARSQSDPAP